MVEGLTVHTLCLPTFSDVICDRPRPSQAAMTTTGRECYIPTRGGTAITDSVCIFPFSYKGGVYTSCITEDNNGRPWCYTSFNYREDHLWGDCQGVFLRVPVIRASSIHLGGHTIQCYHHMLSLFYPCTHYLYTSNKVTAHWSATLPPPHTTSGVT